MAAIALPLLALALALTAGAAGRRCIAAAAPGPSKCPPAKSEEAAMTSKVKRAGQNCDGANRAKGAGRPPADLQPLVPPCPSTAQRWVPGLH